MNECPCGCQRPVRSGRRFAARGCNGRVRFRQMSYEDRVRHIQAFHALNKGKAQEWGALGGRSSNVERWAALLEQWQDDSPRDALREAYKRGYNAGLLAQRRDQRRAARLA